jgi:hypothetical protein
MQEELSVVLSQEYSPEYSMNIKASYGRIVNTCLIGIALTLKQELAHEAARKSEDS